MMNCAGVLKLQVYVMQHFWSPARGCGTKAKNGKIALTDGYTTKVVVTFYLRLRNKFQPFPAKNQASNWLTQQFNQLKD